MLAVLGTIAGLIIFWGSIIGGINAILSVRNWLGSRGKCEFFFPETGIQCTSKVLKGSVYCEVHERKIRLNEEYGSMYHDEDREKESNSNGSANEV